MTKRKTSSFPTGRFVKVHSVRVNRNGTIDILRAGTPKAAKKKRAKRKTVKRKNVRRKTAKRKTTRRR